MNVQMLIDKVQIMEVIHTYAKLVDEIKIENAQKIAASFTEDATHDESVVGISPFKGSSEIETNFERYIGQMSYMFHSTTNILIELETDYSASATSSLWCEGLSLENAKMRLRGTFEDHFFKSDGNWKFTSRRLSLLTPVDYSF